MKVKGRLAVVSACVACVTCLAATEPNPASETPEVEVARVDRGLATSFLRGQINFAPDYRKTNGDAISTSVGQIPPNVDNAARLPHIFVCAIDRDGAGPDANPVFGATDDDVLGCARADDTGYYEMDITGSGADAGVEVYLVTWFCDNADLPFSVVGGAESFADDAELCVRMNVDATNAATRKFLRSREQTLTVGATNNLNWNLSCPNKAGSTTSVAEVVCTNAEEEPTLTGATNSSRAFNKEFAHVFRSAAEMLKTFDSVQPSSANVASTGCGSNGTSACTPCTSTGCVEEINLHVTPAVIAGQTNECSTTATSNVSSGYNHICIIHGTRGEDGTLNPFRPVHEIGHNIHRRWMRDSSDLNQDCGTSGWSSGGDESGSTAEGFANFVAIMAWWNGDMTGFEYDGNDAHDSGDSKLSGTCAANSVVGERRVTQFFVDLWDTDTDETMYLSFTAILRIWSTFDLGNVSVANCRRAAKTPDRPVQSVIQLGPHLYCR